MDTTSGDGITNVDSAERVPSQMFRSGLGAQSYDAPKRRHPTDSGMSLSVYEDDVALASGEAHQLVPLDNNRLNVDQPCDADIGNSPTDINIAHQGFMDRRTAPLPPTSIQTNNTV